MLVGIADSTLEATLAESAQVFKTYNLTMAQTYLDGTQSWDNGMIGPYYIDPHCLLTHFRQLLIAGLDFSFLGPIISSY